MKIGRNQPCVCGSGIKSKKCIPTHPKQPHDLFDDLCDDIVKELDVVNGETHLLPPMNICNRKSKIRLMNSSKGWITMMSRYVSGNINKYYIELNQVWISKKYRGMGLGTKWIETINKISNKYDTEVLVQVSDLDYLEEIYEPQKSMGQKYFNSQDGIDNWNKRFGYNEEFLSNYVDGVNEWVENYEDITDDSNRELLHNINNQRLKEYYTKLGFQPYYKLNQNERCINHNEYFMLYSNKGK